MRISQKEEEIELVIQINGKVKAKIMIHLRGRQTDEVRRESA